MAVSSKDKRAKIFKAFSQNLEWVKEPAWVNISKEFSNGYICPICANIFFESSLIDNVNPLTLEHIPPETLGGKANVLTCKTCNSRSGRELDIHLLNILLDSDFVSLLPNSSTKTIFQHNGNKVNGTVNIGEDGTWNLNFKTQHSNPKEAQEFLKNVLPSKTPFKPTLIGNSVFASGFKSPTFSFTKRLKANEKRAEIALLRIAYLYTFSFFGHGFLLNPNSNLIRKQILNPDSDIFPKPFWIKYDFSDEWDGMNLITAPKELRGFLIIFTLQTESKKRKFAIVLPGFSEPGLDVYRSIEQILGKEHTMNNVTIDHIGEGDIKNKESTFDCIGYWKHMDTKSGV